jgi:hypothetical protein
MRTQDIIRQDMQKNGMGEIAEQFLRGLAVGLQNKALGILREGETVVIFRASDENVLEFDLYTVDAPLALARALKKFYEYAKNAGVKLLESNADNLEIAKLGKAAGIPMQMYKIGNTYKLEIEVQ